MCLNLFETNAHVKGCVANFEHLIIHEQYNMPLHALLTTPLTPKIPSVFDVSS